MKRVCAIQDDEGNFYVIPFELKDKFLELDERIGSENWSVSLNADEEFNKLFSKYKTGGDLNNIELYEKV